MPATDLYEHNAQLIPGTRPWDATKKGKKRYSPDKKWWLSHIVQEGINCNMYEYTKVANGHFSEWNAAAVLVDKDRDNPKLGNEPRVTFNYRNVKEILPAIRMPLMAEVHEFLGHPDIKFFCQWDFKHAYWTISLHKDCRHLYAFVLDDLPQLQPTRLPQESGCATFAMTEVLRIAFGPIPALANGQKMPDGSDGSFPSLLQSDLPGQRAKLTFYMDDLFSGFTDFDEAYEFMRDHLFPRIEWSMFRLSFKKMYLFMESIIALGVQHFAGGRSEPKPARSEKIKNWPVPRNQKDVRSFLAAVGITKSWVKNFSETARPLSRLCGKVPWQWTSTEQLSFELLREMCASSTEKWGFDPSKPVVIYTDASKFAIGCVVIQMHEINGSPVPKPVLYDSSMLNKTQRSYGTYKRELLGIYTFAKKYSYMFSAHRGRLMTDHKPLTTFLGSLYVEGIYARWAAELILLNFDIVYIPGTRNQIADALSRTVFLDPDCELDENLNSLGFLGNDNGEPRWVWKDGAGGYEEFLKKQRAKELEDSECSNISINKLRTSIISPSTDQIIYSNLIAAIQVDDPMWDTGSPKNTIREKNFIPHSSTIEKKDSKMIADKYIQDPWWANIYLYITDGVFQKDSKVNLKQFFRRCAQFCIKEDYLFFKASSQSDLKRCICQSEVAALLWEVHDESGHWSTEQTIKQLRGYYWPTLAKDVRDYILGCIRCAKHGIQSRRMTQSPAKVLEPFVQMGMDFIGPFPKIPIGIEEARKLLWPHLTDVYSRYKEVFGDNFERFNFKIPESTQPNNEFYFTHTLIVIDYFSRFVWAFPTTSTASVEVIRCLSWLFSVFQAPIAVYSDRQPFASSDMKCFFKSHGTMHIEAPVAAHRSVGMVEKAADLFQRIELLKN